MSVAQTFQENFTLLQDWHKCTYVFENYWFGSICLNRTVLSFFLKVARLSPDSTRSGNSTRRGRRRRTPEGRASRSDIVECKVHPPLRTEVSIVPEWLRLGRNIRRGSAERDRFDNRRQTRTVWTQSAKQHRANGVDPGSESWRDPCTAAAGPERAAALITPSRQLNRVPDMPASRLLQ